MLNFDRLRFFVHIVICHSAALAICH